MDNLTLSWSPPPAVVATGWVLTAAAAAACALTAVGGDPPAAILLGVATLILATGSAYATLLRPRLAADLDGLRIRTLGATRALAWPGTELRLATVTRLGREVSTLEVERDESFVVLGRLDLGADPQDVLDALTDLRSQAQAGW